MNVRKAVSLVVAVAAAALLWFAGLGGERAGQKPNTDAEAPEPAEGPADLSLDEPVQLKAAAPQETRAVTEVEPKTADAAPDATARRARVFGRLLDVEGAPIAAQTVLLSSVGEPWMLAGTGPGDLPDQYETQSDAAGVFAFDVPLPTSSWISLSMRTTPFYGPDGRHFGQAGGRREPPLLAGDNDLGDFVLRTTGAISGRVSNGEGEPIAGAVITASGSGSTRTRADGTYDLGSVVPGVRDVGARANGYVVTSRPGVEIAERAVTASVDFTLERATSIAGRVVDGDGAPLKGVRLWGWPASSGRGAGGRTRDDGTFTVYLPQTEPYTLEATLAGYAKYDPGRAVTYPPGTTGIEVVMERLQLTTFRVRDAESGAPIERFGLRTIRVRTADGKTSSNADDDPAPLANHVDGEKRVAAEPAFDDYTIHAPGYAPERGPVRHDGEGEPVQTLLLAPEATITGRYVLNGAPLSSSAVRVEADRLPIDPTRDEDEDDIFSSNWTTDVGRFAGRERSFGARADGTFHIDQLAAGTYELTFMGAGVAPKKVERIHVMAGEAKDLGDIHAATPSSLGGVLRMPQGLSPAGLKVMPGDSDFGDSEKAQTVDQTGRFLFDGLAAGKHILYVAGRKDLIAGDPRFEFELGPSERREVDLDLTTYVTCRVEVFVELGGVPAAGVQVRARTRDAGGRTVHNQTRDTGADGSCAFDQRAGRVLLESTATCGLSLMASETVELVPGGNRSVVLSGPAPAGLVMIVPDDGTALGAFSYLQMQRTDVEANKSRLLALKRKLWKTGGGLHRADLGPTPPGTYTIELRMDQGMYDGEVTLTAGAESECVLTLRVD